MVLTPEMKLTAVSLSLDDINYTINPNLFFQTTLYCKKIATKNPRAEGPATVGEGDGRHDGARSLLTADGTADPPEGGNSPMEVRA